MLGRLQAVAAFVCLSYGKIHAGKMRIWELQSKKEMTVSLPSEAGQRGELLCKGVDRVRKS